MKKNLTVLVSYLLICTIIFATNIKGKVIDTNTSTPLDYVNVTLFKKGNTTPIANTTSDSNGKFSVQSINKGKYTVRISYVGYTTHSQELIIEEQPIDLGTISLASNTKNLSELEVVGQGTQMRFDIDKKVFSVDKNIAASGGSASDVLKNIPSVKVDNDGNVSLRKDANVEVWINGKPSGLTADNRAQVLQQMPAESIESIEVMTNPSAKFNPEGTAGIINLVMKKNRKAGYYGSLSAGLMYPTGGKLGETLGANVNINSGKVDAYLNIGYRAMSFQGGGKTDRYNYNGTDTTLLKQNSITDLSYGGVFMRAGIDYRLNAKNTLSIGGFGMDGTGDSKNTINNVFTNEVSKSQLRKYDRIITGDGFRPSLNINLDYRHDFDTKGKHNILSSLAFSRHSRGSNNRYEQNDLTTPKNDVSQNSKSIMKELVFKTDYSNKITETNRLEAGWQSTLSNRVSNASGFYTQTNAEIWAYKNTFDYNELIHAAYITYGDRFFDKLSAQVGIRGEFTDRKFSYLNSSFIPESIDPKPTIKLFPSMYLAYSISKTDELQLNFTRRVNRPRREINPFRDYSDSTRISYGNPNLLPEYSSALELNYIKTWTDHSLSASVYYRFTDNVIEKIQFINGGTIESTYLNIAKRQNSGMELVAKNRLFTILNLTSSLNLYYSKMDSSVYEDRYTIGKKITIPGQSTFSWSANMIASFMLSKTFSGQITGEYSAPTLIAQGKESAEYQVDLGLRKTFLDRKLSVNLMATDIFNFNKERTVTSGVGFYQNAESYFHRRMIGVTVSYNFGNMKPKQTDTKKKGPSNDMNIDMAE